jgi:glycosyltransferase involved in cell wall biosynthesis
VKAPVRSAKRVLVFSDAVGERNGVGSYYADLVSHLTELGQDIELICPGLAGGRWDGRVRLPLPGDATQRVVVPPASLIFRYVEHAVPDVIVVATPGPYGLVGLALARRHGVRLLVGFHTSFERVVGLYWNWLINALTRWYFGTCDRLLFRTAEVVIANSDDMARLARRLGATDVQVIGTPLPPGYLGEPQPLRRGGSFYVVYAGRLAKEKNVLAIVDAAAACPDIWFRIAGDGPLSHAVADKATKLPNLDYLGWLTRERLCGVVDTADLLVLPSHVEAFGTSALEAMARARNVLVSRNCGIAKWPHLERGLFRMSNEEDMASALRRIKSLDPALRQEKARFARRAALDLHDAALRSWLELLDVDGGD